MTFTEQADQVKFSIAASEWEKSSHSANTVDAFPLNDKCACDNDSNISNDDLNLISGACVMLVHKMIRSLNNAGSSDTVKLTHVEDDILCGTVHRYFVAEDDPNAYKCPADLFFANTVPIKDVDIVVDETKKLIDENQHGFLVNFKVDIFENIGEIIEGMSDDVAGRFRVVGAGRMGFPHIGTMFFALILRYGTDGVQVLTLPDNISAMGRLGGESLSYLGSNFIGSCLITWYAIQVAMLNPATKDLFENPEVIRYQIKPGMAGNNTKKRKAVYRRIHVIKKGDLENRLFGGDRRINRTCLCWYVIGHWREYKNGKKTFVQGYWKGVLRETKMNHDEGRERVVDV